MNGEQEYNPKQQIHITKEMHERDEKRQRERTLRGIIRREILDGKIHASISDIETLLVRFFEEYTEEKRPFYLKDLSYKKTRYTNNTIWEILKLSAGNFGTIGRIFVDQINETTCRIQIVVDPPFPQIEVEDEIPLYNANVKVMKHFSNYLVDWFKDTSSISISSFESLVKHKGKRGRPHLPEDLWAYEQVVELNKDKVEVFKEWKNKSAVIDRELQDEDRHFKAITTLGWKRDLNE